MEICNQLAMLQTAASKSAAATSLSVLQQVAKDPSGMRTLEGFENDTAAAAVSSGIVQRLALKLPYPKQSGDNLWEVDTGGRGAEYLPSWIEQAAKTNRPALQALISNLRGFGTTTVDDKLLALAEHAFQRPQEPLLEAQEDEDVIHIGDAAIDAQRVDYINSRSYLTEGEGTVLAHAWGVDASIYEQPVPTEPFIRRIIRYGEGNAHRGILLFVNSNHYIVIEPTGGDRFDFRDQEGNKFKRGAMQTVADGNCLIDGLFIVRNKKNALAKDMKTARRTISSGMSDEAIIQILTMVVHDVSTGDRPAQIGAAVTAVLAGDPLLMERERAAKDARRPKKPPSSPDHSHTEPRSDSRDAVSGDPVIGLEGISYLGPTKGVEEGSEAIHRGVVEIETVKGVPYVRLYSAVAAAADFTSSDAETGVGDSAFKDVQQDAASGKIIISTGANGMMWTSGGRVLRQMKWAEKYIAEHQARAASETEKAEALELELIRARASSDDEKIDELAPLIDAARKQAAISASINNPLIRSFLIPLSVFNDISKRAISEAQATDEGFEDRTFNVDRHAEPNQFGVKGGDLDLLREHALPQSLITHAYDPEATRAQTEGASKETTAGEIRDAAELRARMGVPDREVFEPGNKGSKPEKYSVWIEGAGFIDRKHTGPKANQLNMYYVTWLQVMEGRKDPGPHPLLAENKKKIPFESRSKMLDDFLAANGLRKPEAAYDFMHNVVAPWATQAMLEHTMAEDYDTMDKDENVKAPEESGFGTNAFAQNREEAAERRKAQQATGQRIDEIFRAGGSPVDMLDFLIGEVPELKPFFTKISAKSEQYEFYEHAQMVLGQFMKIATTDEHRVISRTAMAKMILFHDIEKTNSKAQFGKDPEGEHRLTVEMMRNYRDLWSEESEFKAIEAIVSGDPFGEYMKGKYEKEEAFVEIIHAARKAGLDMKDYRAFFLEFHQFYQSDFSSYSSRSQYRTRPDKSAPLGKAETKRGKKQFDDFFVGADDDSFKPAAKREHLEYNPEGALAGRFTALDAMFTDEDTITGNILKLDQALAPRGSGISTFAIEKAKRRKTNQTANLKVFQAAVQTFLKKYLTEENKVEVAKAMGLHPEALANMRENPKKIKTKQIERYTRILGKLGFERPE
ncbi:MAG: hypothetical protein R8G34_05755 [Paracoccaceae bacterium]|nr:hypothetical protein [Paracoccaceae bacterium]